MSRATGGRASHQYMGQQGMPLDRKIVGKGRKKCVVKAVDFRFISCATDESSLCALGQLREEMKLVYICGDQTSLAGFAWGCFSRRFEDLLGYYKWGRYRR